MWPLLATTSGADPGCVWRGFAFATQKSQGPVSVSFYFFGLGAEEECGARCRLAPLRRDVAVPVRDDFRDDFCLRLANGGDARGSSCLPTVRGDCVREGPAADAEEESCCVVAQGRLRAEDAEEMPWWCQGNDERPFQAVLRSERMATTLVR